MNAPAPQEIFLKDYRQPDYWVTHVDLEFDLGEEVTKVRSRLTVTRHRDAKSGTPLKLNGEHLKLLSVSVGGVVVTAYEVDDEFLTLPMGDAETQSVEIEVEISPLANTALSGLYTSDGLLTTQCEAEGFRRITYMLDRPDVMATYKVRLEGDKAALPVLLSNGNKIDGGDLESGRHFAVWEDPHPKPCYLFALVAGKLDVLEDSFTTMSGRQVALKIYIDPGKAPRAAYAMDCLKRSMKWDEERFGLEYDLDIFMIVAVNAFNAGAMENKGLNIFNDKYILADPTSATDADYGRIEGIVAHEYFHNWTGNRVTCRDWFQLSLKEGLTVFRDQEFTSDMRSRPVKRAEDVVLLRTQQFPEDSGPLSHPPRPDHFIEIDNFFTRTVYEKGAELCGMLRTFLGDEGFRKGMDLYFERCDGTAATVEDFVSAMGDANGRDFGQFMRWYSQSGTPKVTLEFSHDPDAQTLDMTVRQEVLPTADQKEKAPLHMPLKMGLIGADGAPVPLQLEGENEAPNERVLEITEHEQRFRFQNIDQPVIPSVFRDFSAPVEVSIQLSEAEQLQLIRGDSNQFNRWDTGRQFALGMLIDAVRDCRGVQLPDAYLGTLREILNDSALEDDFIAQCFALPSAYELAQRLDVIDPDKIDAAKTSLSQGIGQALESEWLKAYESRTSKGSFTPDAGSAGRRAVKNRALAYLMAADAKRFAPLAARQFDEADNMTDMMGALEALNHADVPERAAGLDAFYKRWSDDPVVIDKWFRLQAQSSLEGTFETVQRLEQDPVFNFKRPNKIYALLGAFSGGNLTRFHDASGAPYIWLADRILQLDKVNPEVATTLMENLSDWRKFEPGRKALLSAQMERIAATEGLSSNLFEIVTKTLSNAS